MLDKKGPENSQCLTVMLSRKGSRREEIPLRSADCLSFSATCLTRRTPGALSVKDYFCQGRAANAKKSRREVLIECFVMSRSWQEKTRERSKFPGLKYKRPGNVQSFPVSHINYFFYPHLNKNLVEAKDRSLSKTGNPHFDKPYMKNRTLVVTTRSR